MGISHRGNFTLAPQHGPDNEPGKSLGDGEAEWCAQWEPTLLHTQTGIEQLLRDAAAGERVELEVVVFLRARRKLQIKLVA